MAGNARKLNGGRRWPGNRPAGFSLSNITARIPLPTPSGPPSPRGRGFFSPPWGEGKSAKNPPLPEKRGISITICSTQYAERILATSRAVLLDCRQAETVSHAFAPGQARYPERKQATGRAVLLNFRQVKSIRHEFVRGDSPQYMSKGSMPRTGWPFSDR